MPEDSKPARKRSPRTGTATKKTARKTASGSKPRATKAAAPRKSKSAVAARPTADQIRDRAYYIFLERGCTHGNDMQDWLQAERELIR